jgi:hypothetical protein
LVRERLANLCRTIETALRDPALRQETCDNAMFERLANIAGNRAEALQEALA